MQQIDMSYMRSTRRLSESSNKNSTNYNGIFSQYFNPSEFFDGACVADCVAKRVCVGESGRGWL